MATTTEKNVTLKLSKPEALALLVAAEKGLKLIETFDMVKDPRLMEQAVRALRAAT